MTPYTRSRKFDDTPHPVTHSKRVVTLGHGTSRALSRPAAARPAVTRDWTWRQVQLVDPPPHFFLLGTI
jgi:hypothetical protein